VPAEVNANVVLALAPALRLRLGLANWPDHPLGKALARLKVVAAQPLLSRLARLTV
jgi:hypothetical protein